MAKGHGLNGGDPLNLKGRCDSFVVETNVHYPTDINLLWDAMRKIVVLTARECDRLGILEWRQHRHILKKIKKLYNHARRSCHGQQIAQYRITAHKAYLSVAANYVERARETMSELQSLEWCQIATSMAVAYYIGHAKGRWIRSGAG